MVRAATFLAFLAALYALSTPVSKLLMTSMDPVVLASTLYFGAGVGMLIGHEMRLAIGRPDTAPRLDRSDLPYVIAMVLLDVVAPILLLIGLASTGAATVALLNNFEIVATSLIALVVFGEKISPRLWASIGMTFAASVVLSLDSAAVRSFSPRALLVIGACICWGIENNCTRKISEKSSEQIVIVKGFGSGIGSLLIGLAIGAPLPGVTMAGTAMVLGFVAYALSIICCVLAQKTLAAAKTSAYYSVTPFFSVAFSFILLGERPDWRFYVGLALMAIATIILMRDVIGAQHTHAHGHVHTHEHRHEDLVNTHPHAHMHSHTHVHLPGQEAIHEHTHTDFPDHVDGFSGHHHVEEHEGCSH